MKAKNKKILVIAAALMTAVLCVAGLTGCGSSSGSTDQASASSTSADDGTVTGMVKSVDVDNNEITLSIMPGGGNPPDNKDGDASSGEAPSGNPPEKPSGDDSDSAQAPSGEAPSGNPPEKPSGDDSDSAQAPSGEAPSGDAPEMEEKTYTITSDTVITNSDGDTIELKDVTEGSMITLKGATEKSE